MKKNPEIFPAEILRCEELQEDIDKRTINSKTYHIATSKHRLRKVIGAVHYKEGTEWKEIDLTITEDDDCFSVNKTLYEIKIFKDKIGYSYKSKKGGRIDVMLNAVDDVPIEDLSLDVKPRIVVGKENRLVWKDAVEGIDFFMLLRPVGADIFKSIKNDMSPHKFKWDIYEDAITNASLVRKTVGHDKDKKKMEVENNIDDKGVFKSKETGNDYRHLLFIEEFKDRVAKIKDRRTRIKNWSTDVSYPAVMDVHVTENIIANIDDGHEWYGYSTWLYRGMTYIYPGYSYGYSIHGGVRFQDIPIPQGSTIAGAWLSFPVPGIVGSPQINIYGDDVDDASQWADGNLPSSITKTNAHATWSPIATGMNFVDVQDIVQEIISRGGWLSDNAMRFALLNNKTGANHLVQISDYGLGAAATVLDILYAVPPTVPPPRYEDYTIFTEIDPDSELEVTPNRVRVASQSFDLSSRVYKDYGVGHFSGNFRHQFELYLYGTIQTMQTGIWGVSNIAAGWWDFDPTTMSIYLHHLAFPLYILSLVHGRDVDWVDTATEWVIGTRYFLTIERIGTLYRLTIRLGSHSGLVRESIELDAGAITPFRYLYAHYELGIP